MTEQQLWSLIHAGVGGVALEDGAALDEGDQEMMLGLYAFDDASGSPASPGGAGGRRGRRRRSDD